MEIRVEQCLTGREMGEEILRRHGSRKALERAAEGGDLEAQDDLATLRLMDERSGRLDEVYDVKEVARLTTDDLTSLSKTSLRILEFVEAHPGATRADIAEHLGLTLDGTRRNLVLLGRLGFVQVQRVGRLSRVRQTPGLDIHITTRPKPAAGAES